MQQHHHPDLYPGGRWSSKQAQSATSRLPALQLLAQVIVQHCAGPMLKCCSANQAHPSACRPGKYHLVIYLILQTSSWQCDGAMQAHAVYVFDPFACSAAAQAGRQVPQVQGRHSCRQAWAGRGLAPQPEARGAGPLQGRGAWGEALEASSHSQVGSASQ